MKKVWANVISNKFNYDDILFGYWCLNEKDLMSLDESRLKFIPDPYTTLSDMRKYEKIASDIADHYLPLFSKFLNKKNNVNYSTRYWEVIIMPWLSSISQLFCMRLKQVE